MTLNELADGEFFSFVGMGLSFIGMQLRRLNSTVLYPVTSQSELGLNRFGGVLTSHSREINFP
jgi:hypothetical protein